MAVKIQTYIRTVDEMDDESWISKFQDPHGLLRFSNRKVKAYRENPFLISGDQPCQLIGVCEGVVVARRNSYVAQFIADGAPHHCRITGSTYVDANYRSSLYAISLLKQALALPYGDVAINCGLSVQNQKFYKLVGATILPLLTFEAGGGLAPYYKFGNFRGWKYYAAFFINSLIRVYNHTLGMRRWRGLPAWTVKEIDHGDVAFLKKASSIVSSDRHRFREHITSDWIRWTLCNDFIDDENAVKKLFAIYDCDNLVGFAMTRWCITTKAGKIYEWQMCRNYDDMEGELLCVVAREVNRHVEKVNVSVGIDSIKTIRKLKSRFPQLEGNCAAVTIAKESDFAGCKEITESKNWRVRPGMGDAPFW